MEKDGPMFQLRVLGSLAVCQAGVGEGRSGSAFQKEGTTSAVSKKGEKGQDSVRPDCAL